MVGERNSRREVAGWRTEQMEIFDEVHILLFVNDLREETSAALHPKKGH